MPNTRVAPPRQRTVLAASLVPGDTVTRAIPAMPIAAPGMDAPAYGGREGPYDLLLVQNDSSTRV